MTILTVRDIGLWPSLILFVSAAEIKETHFISLRKLLSELTSAFNSEGSLHPKGLYPRGFQQVAVFNIEVQFCQWYGHILLFYILGLTTQFHILSAVVAAKDLDEVRGHFRLAHPLQS